MPIGLIVFDRFAHWATGINLYIRASVSAYTDHLTHSLQAINTVYFLIPYPSIGVGYFS